MPVIRQQYPCLGKVGSKCHQSDELAMFLAWWNSATRRLNGYTMGMQTEGTTLTFCSHHQPLGQEGKTLVLPIL